MSDNKFIERLKGKNTNKSVLEINNEAAKTSFANMPSGTSNAIDVYSDHRADATAVLNGTTNWKISNSSLILANNVSGDGNDFSSTYSVSGAGLWINSVYTFPSTGDPAHPVAMVFNPSTKWVLKVCGDNLIVDGGYIADFTLLVKIGTSNIFTKTFSVAEQAGPFCKEFVLDFNETNAGIIKASGLSTLTVQLLCGTANASARIYNGMTVLTCLQRKVDASTVSTSFANVEEALQDGILPSDYFNNAAYIGEVEDGERAYAVFERDGDNMNLAGWDEPIPDQTGNSGKFLTTDGSLMSWAQLTISDVDGLSTELGDLQDQIDDLSGRGRFLALWNCATGLAESNPPESPYPYKAGDYFVVGTVSSADPAVNYKPDGSSYTTGVASTTVETNEVSVNDTYFYDGTVWKLQSNAQKEVSFSALAGSPYDNTNLSNALNGLQGQITTNKDTMDSHIADTNNPHSVTKAQVGLGNVDNTSDLNKPISTATQTALDLKADKSTTYTKTETDTLLGAKQDTISDLSTIRSNAQAGKAASDTIATYGDIVTHDVAEFATAAQGALADSALQPGDNISELVNDVGYLTQHQTLADLGITATASEINVLDGITATTTELNYTDGVTSNIQTQLNAKAVDTDVVHKTGNETISGTKTFNETLQLKSNLSFRSYGSSDSGRLQFRAQPSDNVIRGTVAITDGYSTAGSGYNGFIAQMVARAGSTTSDPFNTIRVSNKGVEYIQEANDGTITGQYIIVDNYGLIPSARLAASGSVGQVLTKTTTGQDWETLATVATTGSYSDLSGTPTIGNATLTIQKNSVAVDTFTANATVDKSINITVPVSAADVNALPDSTKYVANASMTINNTTYVVTLQLKDQDGNNIGTAQTIDLPLESVVVGGSYDSTNKKIVLTLKDGSTIDIPVGDLVAGLQTEITSTNKLDADLVDDSTSTNKFVTASDKTTWNGKQDAISDLATIRSNASSGASAYTTIQGYGDIVTHSASEFATSAQGAKADTALQSGDNVSELVNDAGYLTGINSSDVTTALGYTPYSDANPNGYTSNIGTVTSVNSVSPDGSGNVSLTIPTVNNPTITITQGGVTKGSFSLNQATGDTIALDAGGGGGSADIDNLTITENADQEIQAVAVIDQNTGIAKTWTGTMAEYEAIVTKDPETEYIITDDIGGSATEIGEITEALNNKVDKGFDIIEFQEPTAANNYTWYKKYRNGWVEQGGIYTFSSSSPHTITLPQQMSSVNYDINISAGYPGAGDNTVTIHIRTDMITTTSFAIQKHWESNNGAYYWQVSGMAA